MKANESRLRNQIAKAEREAKARAEREAREAAKLQAQMKAKEEQAKKKAPPINTNQRKVSVR